MAQPTIQTSFNTGEWAPALNARVDLSKYKSAAALLENFFVDYRGGASTRPGTKYILQAFDSDNIVRLIPFQASFAVGYVLEFGDEYIRFYNNGAPVLETGIAIIGASKAAAANISANIPTSPVWSEGDVVYIQGIVGMTELNGRYFIVTSVLPGLGVVLADLNGVAVDSTDYTTYVSGGTISRVYYIDSPYTAADLALLKFTQNVSTMIICHPNYEARSLTLNTAINWELVTLAYGSTAAIPTGQAAATTLGAGSVFYSYLVTSVDVNGQESEASAAATLSSKLDLRTTAGSNTISWSAAGGASSYNVYKAIVSYAGAVPAGVFHGFIGNTTGLSLVDSNIEADYSLTPPIAQQPFRQGVGVNTVTITTVGSYTTAPTVTFSAPPAGALATGTPIFQAISATIAAGGTGYPVSSVVFLTLSQKNIILIVNTNGSGVVTSVSSIHAADQFTGALPASPLTSVTTNGVSGSGATFNIAYGVRGVSITASGSGYFTAPTVTFSAGTAAGTAVLQENASENPSVPIFYQQRLGLMAKASAPQSFDFSQPGSPYNFNISNPIQEDDAISGSLVAGQLNTIKSAIAQQSGLLILTDKASWLINGGSNGAAITPTTVSANIQSFNGASDVPPIVANFDVLYVQAKGSIVRDASYNFYTNVFTGTDISILSSHLFYGYEILEWAWAEEPFKVAWVVRNDGVMLTLTFLKEQEFIGWAHSITDGLFKSVATITEATDFGSVDAVYVVVERTINGNTVKYIERVAERIFPNGAIDAWCVDAGLQYDGALEDSFTGGEHLAGETVTGLADGVVIPPFVMPTNGNFTIAAPASKVTVGLGYTCDLQTLDIDLGEPTVQGKRKVITAVTTRVQDTLGLQIGRTFDTLVNMKDLTVGNVGSASNEVVTDLVTGDARTIIDAAWTVPGRYCIRQPSPLPATILGVIPEVVQGDTKGKLD